MPSNPVSLIYDLTYQKGLRLSIFLLWSVKYTWLLSTTWHIKRDYDILSPSVTSGKSPSYLRPDISKGITTSDSPHQTIYWNPLIYDLTYQKGLRRWPRQPWTSALWPYLRPDISKGITTFTLTALPDALRAILIYDLTYQKGLRLEMFSRPKWIAFLHLIYDLTYQKGLRRIEESNKQFSLTLLSTTWHIKRDYDLERCLEILYAGSAYLRPDISKGITTSYVFPSMFPDFHSYLRPDISKGITTNYPKNAFNWDSPTYLRPDISKGITTLIKFTAK